MTGAHPGGGPRRVEVVIDELILHGFDARQSEPIADAVRTGLAGALEGWNPARGSIAAHVEAGAFAVPAGAAPADVGSGVAHQVGHALTGRESGPHSAARGA